MVANSVQRLRREVDCPPERWCCAGSCPSGRTGSDSQSCQQSSKWKQVIQTIFILIFKKVKYFTHFQVHGGLVPNALNVELHSHELDTVALVNGVGDVSATPTGRFLAKSLNRGAEGILNARILKPEQS